MYLPINKKLNTAVYIQGSLWRVASFELIYQFVDRPKPNDFGLG
jgi:hypothetical protein